MNSVTPLMKQYLEIKSDHEDKILMFRLGDFYEMFYEDAKVASSLLNIALTARNKKVGSSVPMCGVPYHSVSSHISKLLAHGHKVALCDQVEDAKEAKGIVKRAVTQILSPGMVYDPETLNSLKAHYLCAFDDQKIAFLDVSTGEAFYYLLEGYEGHKRVGQQDVFSFIFLLLPAELVLKAGQKEELEKSKEGQKVLKEFHITVFNDDLTDDLAFQKEKLFEATISNSFEIVENRELDHLNDKGILKDGKHPVLREYRNRIEENESRVEDNENRVGENENVLQFLKSYVRSTQGAAILKNLNSFENRTFQNQMMLSHTLCQHLEIFQGRFQDEKGSLFHAISRTKTAQGARLLKNWLSFPLTNRVLIEKRLSEVDFWVQNPEKLKSLREHFSYFSDLERGIGKLAHLHLNARDLVSIKKSLAQGVMVSGLAYDVQTRGRVFSSPFVFEFLESEEGRSVLVAVENVIEEIERVLLEEAPLSTKQGGMVRRGVSSELDQWACLAEDSKKLLFEMEAREKKKTNIPSLKIRYNQVFGYYIEVTNIHKHKVPSSYIRRQTLTQGERFITDELKDLEVKILLAKEKREQFEFKIFEELRAKVLGSVLELKIFSNYLSQIDVLSSLAWLALELNYTRPRFNLENQSFLEIKESRHPVLEQEIKFTFVSNDLRLDSGECMLLTGPNMAGKSTIMRQVALISILAQIGSFVPARDALLPVFEHIFTRIGASDHLLEGLSTFMLEMKETVHILERANSKSLVILDEIGRGTSTYDGLSLAQALLEFLVLEKKPYILFATHYHELISLSERLSQVHNFHMRIAEKRDSLSQELTSKSNGQKESLEAEEKERKEKTREEIGEEIEFLYKLAPGSAKKSYGIFVAKLAGFPLSVIHRAKVLLHSFESEVRVKSDE